MLIAQNNVLHYDILIHVYHGPSYSHSVCTFFETRSRVVQTASAPTFYVAVYDFELLILPCFLSAGIIGASHHAWLMLGMEPGSCAC